MSEKMSLISLLEFFKIRFLWLIYFDFLLLLFILFAFKISLLINPHFSLVLTTISALIVCWASNLTQDLIRYSRILKPNFSHFKQVWYLYRLSLKMFLIELFPLLFLALSIQEFPLLIQREFMVLMAFWTRLYHSLESLKEVNISRFENFLNFRM